MRIFSTKKNRNVNPSKLVIKRFVKREAILKVLGTVSITEYSKWKVAEYEIKKTNQNLNNTNNLISSYNKRWDQGTTKPELFAARKQDLIEIYANRAYASKPYNLFQENYTYYIKTDHESVLDLEIKRIKENLDKSGFSDKNAGVENFSELLEDFEKFI